MVTSEEGKLSKAVLEARRASELREQTYREQALKMYPHICGRCGREFKGKNLSELTVHHRDHNHEIPPMAVTGSCCVCIATITNTNASWKYSKSKQGVSNVLLPRIIPLLS